MRAMPRWHDAPRRSVAPPSTAQAARFERTGKRPAERDGTGNARRFDLWLGADGFRRDPFGDGSMEAFLVSEDLQVPSRLRRLRSAHDAQALIRVTWVTRGGEYGDRGCR